MESIKIAELCYKIAEEKKAEDIKVLDVSKLFPFSDYFFLCSGVNHRHVQAIAKDMEKSLRQQGVKPLHQEGMEEGRWVLLDFNEVIAHIFLAETRNFYELEELWADSEEVEFSSDSDSLASQEESFQG